MKDGLGEHSSEAEDYDEEGEGEDMALGDLKLSEMTKEQRKEHKRQIKEENREKRKNKMPKHLKRKAQQKNKKKW